MCRKECACDCHDADGVLKALAGGSSQIFQIVEVEVDHGPYNWGTLGHPSPFREVRVVLRAELEGRGVPPELSGPGPIRIVRV